MYELSQQDRECCPVRLLVVSLPEQVDASSAGPVREQLLSHVDDGVRVLIADMTGVILCDHAGAEALARVYERAVANGTELRLVIRAVAVRRVIAISGLDRLVSVFLSLAAAQSARPPAGVLRQLPRGRATRSAGLAAVPGGPRPVSRLPVPNPAAVKPGSSIEQAVREDRFAETLAQISGGIFQAALTLQTATGLPADAGAQAVEEALDLLDSTISQARTAAFTLADAGANRPAGPGARGAVVPLGRRAVPGALAVAAEDARRRAQRLTQAARQARAQSTQRRARSMEAKARSERARAHAVQVAGLAAATRYRATAAFC